MHPGSNLVEGLILPRIWSNLPNVQTLERPLLNQKQLIACLKRTRAVLLNTISEAILIPD